MTTLLPTCAAGVALLVSIAAAPFSGDDRALPGEATVAKSGVFSGAMLDNSKARWAREGQARLASAAVEITAPTTPAAPTLPPSGETTGGSTVCPVQHTECPVEPTVCPTVDTKCPQHQTVCQTTKCPTDPTVCEPTVCPRSWTSCPKKDTECPTDPTVCEWTVCPEDDTNCPADPTECPIELTECPIIDCICITTYQAGPSVSFVPPRTIGHGSQQASPTLLAQLGTRVPFVTYVPTIGG